MFKKLLSSIGVGGASHRFEDHEGYAESTAFPAFRRWVFPDEFGRDPEKALESTLTGGGIAEALEDEYESRKVTPLRRPARRARMSRPLDDTADPGISKTS